MTATPAYAAWEISSLFFCPVYLFLFRPAHAPLTAMRHVVPGLGWGPGFRAQAVKWGLFLTMIVFSFTLVDRQADILIAASVLVAVLLNLSAWLY